MLDGQFQEDNLYFRTISNFLQLRDFTKSFSNLLDECVYEEKTYGIFQAGQKVKKRIIVLSF
jgi:hypothetical protein